ncbi:MAG: DUF3244 domain-containing protein [Bacteroidota bacterium]
MYKFSLAVTLSLLFCVNLSAQTEDSKQMMSFAGEEIETVEATAKSFFVDEDSQTYFIDFQNLNVNLNAIVVKDESGKVVVDDKVFDLPVDTIYELDLSRLAKGRYKVELQSFSKVIRKSITLR